MTCIVAVKQNGIIYMGADSGCGLDTGETFILETKKIIKKDNMLLGISGFPRVINLVQYGLIFPVDECDDPMEYLVRDFVPSFQKCLESYGFCRCEDGVLHVPDSRILIGYKGRLFQVEANFQVIETIDDFAAIGSGCQVALGSMYSSQMKEPQERLELALDSAERYDNMVSSPFNFERIGE